MGTPSDRTTPRLSSRGSWPEVSRMGDILRTEAGRRGALLVGAAAVALVWANSLWGEAYQVGQYSSPPVRSLPTSRPCGRRARRCSLNGDCSRPASGVQAPPASLRNGCGHPGLQARVRQRATGGRLQGSRREQALAARRRDERYPSDGSRPPATYWSSAPPRGSAGVRTRARIGHRHPTTIGQRRTPPD